MICGFNRLKEGRGIWTEVKASSITDRDPT